MSVPPTTVTSGDPHPQREIQVPLPFAAHQSPEVPGRVPSTVRKGWHFCLCWWGWWGVLVWQVVWGCLVLTIKCPLPQATSGGQVHGASGCSLTPVLSWAGLEVRWAIVGWPTLGCSPPPGHTPHGGQGQAWEGHCWVG